MFETFEHTADLGLRIQAPDLNTLFAEAGLALASVMVEDLNAIRPADRLDFRSQGEQIELLFFDWLNELLFRFEAEHRLFGRFEAQVNAGCLSASAWGESFDQARHRLSHEVKAITYHGLVVQPTSNGWVAEVIVDI